jgi:predicted nucleotidyltransferase
MSTWTNSENLASALFGKTRRALLALFYAHPDESFYLRKVARAIAAGQGSVQRELRRLSEAGIIVRVVQGRQVYYQANRLCPIFAELHGLMVKTAGLADVLRAVLSPMKKEIDLAFVFGSQATGTATAASDVDLLVVGDPDELRLHRAISRAEKQLGRTVNYTLLSRREFGRRGNERGGFLRRILSGAKIPIVGVADEV